MTAHDAAKFGDVLKNAIHHARMNQAEVAHKLSINPSQVSRWVNNKSMPHIKTVGQLETILRADLMTAYEAVAPAYELFVSAPITGLGRDGVREHHDAVAAVVEAAYLHVSTLYWPGADVRSTADLMAADFTTERNLTVLNDRPSYLYLQFADIVRPSSALVELGFALAKRCKTTLILRQGINTPFMLNGFSGVAAGLDFLPKARIYWVRSVDDAAGFVRRNGREVFGLT